MNSSYSDHPPIYQQPDITNPIYMNRNTEPIIDQEMNNTQGAGTLIARIDNIKDMWQIKNKLSKIIRAIISTSIALVLIICIGFIIGYTITNDTYKEVVQRIDQEDSQIMDGLRRLYKDCKENPLNFDWTAQIFDKINDAKKEIISALENQPERRFSKGVTLSAGGTLGGFYPDDFNGLMVKLEKGEGLHIATGSKEMVLSLDELLRKVGEDTIEGGSGSDKKRKRDKDKTKWIGPTGIPGRNVYD
nr:putative SH protein [Paramyxoviridae sp.]